MKKLNFISIFIIAVFSLYIMNGAKASPTYEPDTCVLDMDCVETETYYICCSFCPADGDIKSCGTIPKQL